MVLAPLEGDDGLDLAVVGAATQAAGGGGADEELKLEDGRVLVQTIPPRAEATTIRPIYNDKARYLAVAASSGRLDGEPMTYTVLAVVVAKKAR